MRNKCSKVYFGSKFPNWLRPTCSMSTKSKWATGQQLFLFSLAILSMIRAHKPNTRRILPFIGVGQCRQDTFDWNICFEFCCEKLFHINFIEHNLSVVSKMWQSEIPRNKIIKISPSKPRSLQYIEDLWRWTWYRCLLRFWIKWRLFEMPRWIGSRISWLCL